MEQCLRIALWMFLLTGYLQAHPIDCFNTMDLDFYMLRTDSCKNNMTFETPTNVEPVCYAKALETFKKGMMDALNETNKRCEGHIRNTVEALRSRCLEDTQTNCSFTTVHQEFTSFVDETERFVQQVNSYHRKP